MYDVSVKAEDTDKHFLVIHAVCGRTCRLSSLEFYSACYRSKVIAGDPSRLTAPRRIA